MRFLVTETTIPDGDAGIDATVRHMAALMRQGAQLPAVRRVAAEIAYANVGDGAPSYALAAAIRQWVEAHWEFREDPAVHELLYAPDTQLAIIGAHGTMQADCDDAAILVGAIGLAAGLRVRVICVGFLTPDAPYTHTWSELRPPLGAGAWLEGDVTRPMQRLPEELIARAAAWDV